MESSAEAQRLSVRKRRLTGADAERTGETLLDLVITDHEPGLGGRFLITFVKRNRTQKLPWNRLRAGSPVVLTHQDNDETLQGVVSAKSTDAIQIAVDDFPNGSHFRVDLSPDEITRKRQLSALKRCSEARGRLADLRKILLGESGPRFAKQTEAEFQQSLNDSQREAVQFALASEDLAIIHGPPGTGKTTTVVEIICQAVRVGHKVLACAPSNTAVDNLLERLVALGQKTIRLGHPARVGSDLREYSLDMAVQNHENMKIVRDMMREAEQLYRKADRFTRAKPQRGAKQDMRHDAKRLKQNAKLLERQAVDHVLDRADVICATTTLDEELLGSRFFDILVIDEACQSTEPGCWVPLQFADRIILAGDHCQLPPTVISREAAHEGFSTSLMERLIELHGARICRQLNIQYRMHEKIMRFSSDNFYGGTLVAHAFVRMHLLTDLQDVTNSELTNCPVAFIDTAGADWNEELEPDGESRRNIAEGNLVLRKAIELIGAGIRPIDIGIIAPYAAQVRWLRQQATVSDLEIDTVDGFQGREKEAILISLVRSNREGEIGFLSDTRRMNVALTRAKRKLIVIGDSATLGGHPFYRGLLEYFESIQAYRTVWEEDM